MTQRTLSDFEPEPVTDGGITGTKLCSECGADMGAADGSLCDDCTADGFDRDAETVTDAWLGEFISSSWGYGQTNVEFAVITDVSDSGKTVLAQRVGAERVDSAKGSESVRPAGDPFGDEFRLHVRAGAREDRPSFRGTYPTGSDGDMDGPTRRGWLSPVDADSTQHRTATGYGH